MWRKEKSVITLARGNEITSVKKKTQEGGLNCVIKNFLTRFFSLSVLTGDYECSKVISSDEVRRTN